MSMYRILLALLALASLAGAAFWFAGDDPGMILLRRGSWEIETTLVVAGAVLLAALALLHLAWWLLRWPLRTLYRRSEQRKRLQFARGHLALVEGKFARAQHLFGHAATLSYLRLPSLFGIFQSQRAKGDDQAAESTLARLEQSAEEKSAALALKAKLELDKGNAHQALELLKTMEQTQELPPASMALRVEALCRQGKAREAVQLLGRLRRSQMLAEGAMEDLERRTIVQAIQQAADVINLQSLWQELHRSQRRVAEIAVAYVHRAVALNLGAEIDREIEDLLKRNWSGQLALAWSRLKSANAAHKIGLAEAWLHEHSADVSLLIALGRLCRQEKLWAKSEEYLYRAVSLHGGAICWEELGHLYLAQNDATRASQAYANACKVLQGQAPVSLKGKSIASDLLSPAPIAEERNEHGVPRLPQGL